MGYLELALGPRVPHRAEPKLSCLHYIGNMVSCLAKVKGLSAPSADGMLKFSQAGG